MNTKVLRRLDRLLGTSMAMLLSRRKTASFPTNPHRIICIRLWAIGESILTLPAIKAVKDRYPSAEITVLTTRNIKDVFAKQKYIDHIDVLPLSLRAFWQYARVHRQTFDIAIDFEPYLYISAFLARTIGRISLGFATVGRERVYSHSVAYKDQQHVTQTQLDVLRPLGISEQASELQPLAYTDQDQAAVKHLLSKNNISLGQSFAVLVPGVGASAQGRRWPAERFAEVAQTLQQRYGWLIIALGTGADNHALQAVKEKHPEVTLMQTLSLPQSAFLLSKAALVISNDTGPMHMAAAMDTPTVGLFGPNLPIRFRPLNARSTFVYHPHNCHVRINVHIGIIPEGHCSGIDNIQSSDVLSAVEATFS